MILSKNMKLDSTLTQNHIFQSKSAHYRHYSLQMYKLEGYNILCIVRVEHNGHRIFLCCL